MFVWIYEGTPCTIVPGSLVGVRGSNPGGGKIFRPSRPALGAHPASCTMGTGSFSGVNCGWGVLLTTHLLLTPRSWKSRVIPLPPSGPQPSLQRGYFTFLLPVPAVFVNASKKSAQQLGMGTGTLQPLETSNTEMCHWKDLVHSIHDLIGSD